MYQRIFYFLYFLPSSAKILHRREENKLCWINSVGFFTEARKPDICIKQLKGKVYFSPTTTEVKNQTLQKSEYQQATLLPFF